MTYASEVLADTPLVYWRLGDASGTTATDTSGNAKHGTYAGSPTLGVTGAIAGDTAVTFDGSDDKVSIADTTDLTAFTVEAWVKTTSSATRFLLGRDGMFDLQQVSEGRVWLNVTNNAAQVGGAFDVGGPSINDGDWHHIVGTWRSSDGLAVFYVDGVKVASGTRTGTLATTNIAFEVGKLGANTAFPGTLDEIAYYTTALSAARIRAHYVASDLASPYASEIFADAPLVYWRLGESAGTKAADYSGNAQHGTIAGTPTLGTTGLVGDSDTAITFDGTDDKVSVADATNLTAFTVEAWIKKASTPGSFEFVACRDGATGRMFALTVKSGTGFAELVVFNSGGSSRTITGTTNVCDGVAHHIAGSFDTSDSTLYLYVDGVQEATNTRTGTLSTTDTIFAAGHDGASAGNWFSGVIDEVAYYTTRLTGARITAHFDALVDPVTITTEAHGDAQSDASAQATVDVVITISTEAHGDAQSNASAQGTIQIPVDISTEIHGSAESEASAFASKVNAAITDNRTGGRWRNGSGTATWSPAVYVPSEPLLGARLAALAFSSPVIDDDTGRISYTAVKQEIPDHMNRIVVGNRDITLWRGVLTPFPSYSYVEPLGYGPAVLTLPQVHASFERPGEGALYFLRLGSPVIIERVDINTAEVVSRDYKGVIISHDHSGNAFTVQIGGEASGRASLRQKQVPIFSGSSDLGRFAYTSIRGLKLPFDPYLGPVTGITMQWFGGMGHLEHIQQVCKMAWTRGGNQWTVMPHDDGRYRMQRKDTTTIHGTVYLDDGRATGSLVRDMTEEPNRIYMTGVTPESMRVRFGAYPGLKFTPPAPYPFADNRTFGAGTTNAETDTGDGISILINRLYITKYLNLRELPGGYDADVTQAVKDLQKDGGLPRTGTVNLRTWRVLYDLNSTGFSLRGSRIMPAAEDERVKPWNRSASGGIMSRNPEYDPSVLPVERNVDAGTGFTIGQLREWANAELDDSTDDNYVGSITFNTGALITGQHDPGDPFTEADVMPARDLRAGMNLWLPLFAGGIKVHIGGVSVSESGEVSVDVDTRARDAMEVWEVITRNRESRVSLRRAWMNENRQSAQIKDSSGVWDEVGGILGDKIVVSGDRWVVFPVLAGQSGTIRSLRVNTNPNAEYVMAVFGKRINPGRLRRLIGNPLTRAGSKRWEKESVRSTLDRTNWLFYIAGTDEEPLGYFPKTKKKTDDNDSGNAPLTGRWEDDASFPYYSAPTQVIWVAIWADRNTTIPRGRIMWPVLESGT